MLGIVELLDVQSVILKFYERALVVVHVTIIWCTENGYDRWEVLISVPFMHLVSLDLGLVGSDY